MRWVHENRAKTCELSLGTMPWDCLLGDVVGDAIQMLSMQSSNVSHISVGAVFDETERIPLSQFVLLRGMAHMFGA